MGESIRRIFVRNDIFGGTTDRDFFFLRFLFFFRFASPTFYREGTGREWDRILGRMRAPMGSDHQVGNSLSNLSTGQSKEAEEEEMISTSQFYIPDAYAFAVFFGFF